jgi:outer membrane protein OmpA-like peptidoglycan-associated protein/tetratricopeptide (TPR) repeat protein
MGLLMQKLNRIQLLLLCCWALPAVLSAQSTAALKSKADAAFTNGRWAEALDFYSQFQEKKPGNIEVLGRIGQTAYLVHQPDKAKQYLQYVTQQARSNDQAHWFYLARTLHGLQEWEAAIDAYKGYLRFAPPDHLYRAYAREQILRCIKGLDARSNDDIALVENMGTAINSAGDEFAPLPSVNFNDRLYFAASRPESVGGRRNDDGYDAPNNGHWCSDMLVTTRSARGWQMPNPFSSLQNTSRYEYAFDFTNGGRVLHFFRGFTLYGGDILTDTADVKDEYRSAPQVWRSAFAPQNGDEGLFFFDDTTMIFASRRAGGLGGLDLWYATFRDTAWMPPVNFGPEINSNFDETTPYCAPDGHTLYFSSNRREGIGGLDVWKTIFDRKERRWNIPTSMGLGINSPGDDAYFRLSRDGQNAYLSSNRIVDNLGERDLYIVYFKSPQVAEAGIFALTTPPPAAQQTDKLRLGWEPLFYTSDRDVVGPKNNAILRRASDLSKQFPTLRWVVTTHTDDKNLPKFDLYTGIKRAEMVAKSLIEQSVNPDNILIRSAGQGYPYAAWMVTGGTPNAEAGAVNRRIEVVPFPTSNDWPIVFELQRPDLEADLDAGGTARLDQQQQGLIYRVELATVSQVLTSDALGLFTDILVESKPTSGQYRYLAGAERQFSAAANLRKNAKEEGFPDAVIVAYINGWPVSKAEAVGLVKKYPDLANFIKG